jgi:hypothetical protein
MSANISCFGIVAHDAPASLFEQQVVDRLVQGGCKPAWRAAAGEAPPAEVDVIIDLSEREAGRQWCEAAPHGVLFLSAGHGHRLDLVPGLLENFADRAPVLPLTLGRWTTATGPAEVLVTGNLRGRRTPRRHIDSALTVGAGWFATALRRIELDALPDAPAFAPRVGAATVSRTRRLLATAANVLDLVASQFTFDKWNIGVYAGGCARDLLDRSLLSKVRWLPPQDGLHFRADPFAFRRADGDIVILYEKCDYRVGKGVIGAIIDERDAPDVHEFAAHAAYPCLFQHNGVRYCMPEQSETGAIAAFALDEEALTLGEPRIQLPDVPLIDGTVFPFEGLYWLLGTRADDDYNVHLFAWYSESPLGPWRAHACNPVKSDITSARPAGTPFLLNGELIRPAQDCSSTYGGAVVLNRVKTLTPTRFAEEPIGRIEPDPGSRYRDGLHTLCVGDGFIVLDAKYHLWHWMAPLLRRRLDRASARRALQIAQARN